MASRVFAVDLGAWSVKLAIASPGIRGATLVGVYERMLPPAATESDTVEQRAKAVLASLVEELRLRDETGYIGVYGDQVFTQVLEFPFKNLRRAELDKAVGGELEGVVPVDLEDMVYTFEPLPAAPPPVEPTAETRGRIAPPAEGMRVLTYAMRRDRAEDLLALGRTCGFEPRGVLACGGAAARLVERTPSLARARTDGPVAVIDIGHERTDVVVVANGKAVFSRSIARAGKQVTEAIARNWKQLSWAEAERAKHSDGIIASTAEPATSEAWAKISAVLLVELAPFARDLRQTLAACRAKTGFTPIAALLVGGGAKLRGMGSFLGEQLGIAVWRPTSDDAIALAGPRIGSEGAAMTPIEAAAMTVGMAYDAAGGRPQFDLRSGSIAHRMDLTFLRAKAVPLGAAVLAIAAFAAASAYADLYRLRKAEKVLATRLATESAELFGEAKTADQIIKTNGAGGDASSAGSPLPKMSAYDIMLEISNHTPPKEKITLDISSMQIDDQKVDIQGTTKTIGDVGTGSGSGSGSGSGKTIEASEEIDALRTELAKIPCFKDVTRGSTDTVGNGVKRFKLNITSTCM